MSKYFYARVSTKEQNLARQMEVAKGYEDIPQENVFCDKQSGRNFKRPAYQQMLELLQPGDELIVKELDRLGRNKAEVKEQLKELHDKGVTVRILDVPTSLIDFNGQEWIKDMVNNILIEVLGSIAEQEREKILKRQKEGIAAMQIVDGKHWSEKKQSFTGRARKETENFSEYLDKQRRGELTVSECCERLGIKRSCWYDRVKEYESALSA